MPDFFTLFNTLCLMLEDFTLTNAYNSASDESSYISNSLRADAIEYSGRRLAVALLARNLGC